VTDHSDEDDTSDSDSDESVDGKEPDSLPPSVDRSKRRASVCAEKLCTNTMENSEIKIIPKNEEEAERIQLILKKNVLMQHLDEDQRKTVQDAMLLVKKEEDSVIIKQGDDGDNFYIIDSGNVDVFIKQEGDDEPDKLVASYGDGDSFGELAIMYNAPRAATCIAKSDVRLWALDRVSFKVILMKTTISKRNIHKGFLQQVPILSQLTEYEVLTIADALEEENFDDGDVICRQNDDGDRFYIIKEGTAVCSKEDDNGSTCEVARLENGAYFGEIALMTTKPRQATVTASGKLKCLYLDRKTFKRVMGPIQDILMRNIEEYNKFQAAII